MGILLFKCSCLKKFSAARTWVNTEGGKVALRFLPIRSVIFQPFRWGKFPHTPFWGDTPRLTAPPGGCSIQCFRDFYLFIEKYGSRTTRLVSTLTQHFTCTVGKNFCSVKRKNFCDALGTGAIQPQRGLSDLTPELDAKGS